MVFAADAQQFVQGVAGGAALGLQIYVVVWKGQPFDLQAFGIGMGALCASVGAALNLKAKTEPGSEPKA